jgi:single-stranded DNA-binding protein
MNSINLAGRLTKDPKLSERSGKKVCDMRLAVNGSGNTPPVFIDVVAFHGLAESSAELKKGSQVEVKGALRYSEWESKTSSRSRASRKHSKHSVLAREIKLAGSRGKEGA